MREGPAAPVSPLPGVARRIASRDGWRVSSRPYPAATRSVSILQPHTVGPLSAHLWISGRATRRGARTEGAFVWVRDGRGGLFAAAVSAGGGHQRRGPSTRAASRTARTGFQRERDARMNFALQNSVAEEMPASYDAVLCLAVFQHSALKDPAIESAQSTSGSRIRGNSRRHRTGYQTGRLSGGPLRGFPGGRRSVCSAEFPAGCRSIPVANCIRVSTGTTAGCRPSATRMWCFKSCHPCPDEERAKSRAIGAAGGARARGVVRRNGREKTTGPGAGTSAS